MNIALVYFQELNYKNYILPRLLTNTLQHEPNQKMY